MRFDTGPASAVSAMPFLGWLKFLVFTGQGFAQPKPTMSIEMKPIGSRCFTGLSVTLPKFLAVGSPSLYAIKACDAS